MGTPPYIAPEQLDPAQPIDARADVYALGVILYELLCGAQPSGVVPRLPIEIDAAVPEPLQAIALAAMERDPGRRYQSALDMAQDLRRWLDGSRRAARRAGRAPAARLTKIENPTAAAISQIGNENRSPAVPP